MTGTTAFLQVPVLAYRDEKQPIPHSVYESIICNEFLEAGCHTCCNC